MPVRISHHGETVTDDFAWLRDPGYPQVETPEILDYLKAENAYYEAALAPYADLTERLFQEMKGRIREDDESVPFREGDWLYQWRFASGAQYRQWFRRPAAGEGGWVCFLDEPALAEGLDFFRLGGFSVSPDGRLLAWSADTDGSERFTLHMCEIATGDAIDAPITDTIGAPVWSEDSACLLYRPVNANWRPFAVRAHRLGAPLTEDMTLYEESDGGYFVNLSRTQSRRWIAIASASHTTSEIRVVPADDPLAAPVLLSERAEGHEYDLDHAGETFYIRSNHEGANFGIYTVPEDDPRMAGWQPLIAPSERDYIRGHVAFREFLAIEQRRDGLDRIRIREHDGGSGHYVDFPEDVCHAELGINAQYETDCLRIVYESMVTPPTVYDYDIRERQLITRKVQEIPGGYDKADYVTERLMAPARDGVEVPVSLVYRRDLRRPDAPAPLHLYGYGAYGIGMTPGFSTARLSLLDRGFVYAIAHIRGGDEMGRPWYEAGKGRHRINAFTDFIDAAEHLVAKGYATAGGISAMGGSAGGKLMGAIANMRPDLWRAIVAHVPFVDVLNTMLDDSLPLTPIEWPEWGNPGADPEAFRHILSYSPYDNVTAQAYPPIMVTCGLNDPRVTYWEPAKWVARLRKLKTDDNLLILKTNMGAGHAGKSGRFERLREVAEEYTFLLMAFGLTDADEA